MRTELFSTLLHFLLQLGVALSWVRQTLLSEQRSTEDCRELHLEAERREDMIERKAKTEW